MQAVLYSQARNNLRDIINQVCNNFEEFIITTKEKQSAVLISQDEYNSIKETLYLLSSKNNRDRLLDAVEEIEGGKFITKDLNI
jgi:antitoxin YefM